MFGHGIAKPFVEGKIEVESGEQFVASVGARF
jgi:hypothetical protein